MDDLQINGSLWPLSHLYHRVPVSSSESPDPVTASSSEDVSPDPVSDSPSEDEKKSSNGRLPNVKIIKDEHRHHKTTDRCLALGCNNAQPKKPRRFIASRNICNNCAINARKKGIEILLVETPPAPRKKSKAEKLDTDTSFKAHSRTRARSKNGPTRKPSTRTAAQAVAGKVQDIYTLERGVDTESRRLRTQPKGHADKKAKTSHNVQDYSGESLFPSLRGLAFSNSARVASNPALRSPSHSLITQPIAHKAWQYIESHTEIVSTEASRSPTSPTKGHQTKKAKTPHNEPVFSEESPFPSLRGLALLNSAGVASNPAVLSASSSSSAQSTASTLPQNMEHGTETEDTTFDSILLNPLISLDELL